uniref:Uncharacterized protein n=1 Tax=Amphimedon queenslandica TaxID=400682 RepID=A0A1X7V221_AMPQE
MNHSSQPNVLKCLLRATTLIISTPLCNGYSPSELLMRSLQSNIPSTMESRELSIQDMKYKRKISSRNEIRM